jgi:cathepsin B
MRLLFIGLLYTQLLLPISAGPGGSVKNGTFVVREKGLTLQLNSCQVKVPNPLIEIPDSFDARDQWPSCTIPVRDQGLCGACWAFATTNALAARFCVSGLAVNRTIQRLLSPQQLVSCDTGCATDGTCQSGCTGGFVDAAIDYMAYTGVVPETCFPWTESNVACRYNTTCGTYFRVSGSCYQLQTIPDIQREIVSNGPVVAGLEVWSDFDTYSGGVYTVKSNTFESGHAVTLIGWGVDAGVPYWHALNQWSRGWGEDGYLRIRRGTNEAGIEQYVVAMDPDLASLPLSEPIVPWDQGCADCKENPNSVERSVVDGFEALENWVGLHGAPFWIVFALVLLAIILLPSFIYYFCCRKSSERFIS